MNCRTQEGRRATRSAVLTLLVAALLTSGRLWAYQWPAPATQIAQGFLAGRPSSQSREQQPLPSLGYWFGPSSAAQTTVLPYHQGQIIYREASSELDISAGIPRNIDHTLIVQHDKLLFRYSSDQASLPADDQLSTQTPLFVLKQASKSRSKSSQDDKPRFYLEVFDTQSQTVINPKLILPSTAEPTQISRPYVESIARSPQADSKAKASLPVKRSLRRLDRLPRGIYNLSFRFPGNQEPPLQLSVRIDGKQIYHELFDQVQGLNSRLLINNRDLQDIYVPDAQQGKYLLGTLNLQDKLNSTVRLSVDEEHIGGNRSTQDYVVRIS